MVLDIALIGGLPVQIVKNMSHAMGNVAVGHTVGKGVRIFQKMDSDRPEQISLRCMFIDNDRFSRKYALEQISKTKIPFPFISRFAALPLCTITGLLFVESTEKRNVVDKLPVVEFSVTLSEYKVNTIITQAFKAAWVAAAALTLPDPASNVSLNFSTESNTEQQQIPVTAFSETIQANGIEDVSAEDYEDLNFTTAEISASNILNRKFDKIPIDESGDFPQLIKIQYPPSNTHYESFNDIADINIAKHEAAQLYSYPEFSSIQTQQYTLVFKPKQNPQNEETYLTLEIQREGNIVFSKIISEELVYTIDNRLYITFNQISIDTGSVNGSSTQTRIVAGVRLK